MTRPCGCARCERTRLERLDLEYWAIVAQFTSSDVPTWDDGTTVDRIREYGFRSGGAVTPEDFSAWLDRILDRAARRSEERDA